MEESYKKVLIVLLAVIVAVGAYVACPRLLSAYETRNWATYTDEVLGFTLKYPKEMRVQVATQPYKNDPSKKYHTVSFDVVGSDPREGLISLRAVESQDDVDQQYADRERVRIRGKSWRYYYSGELTKVLTVNSAGEADPIKGQPKEYTWYWKEYITRFDPEWKLEAYAEYEDTKYSKILDTMVRSVIFK